MPMDINLYPPDWKEISKRIRLERAGGRCECDGRCKRGHVGRCEARNGDPCATNPAAVVVLTVAHLDAEGDVCRCKELTGRKCGIEDHLAAYCAACHLRYDLPHHMRNAAKTRRMKRVKAGAQLLPGCESLIEDLGAA